MEMADPKEPDEPDEPCLTYVTHLATYKARQCKTRGKRVTAGALLQACEKTPCGFVMEAPQGVSSDDYVASVLPGLNILHAYDVVFVEQVLYGCCRYSRLLGVVLAKLFTCKIGLVHPADGFLFTVLAYLILIRLEELTFGNLCLLILSQNAQKVLPFVESIFNPECLNELCKPEWVKIYDIEYVEELINSVFSFSSEAAELEAKLAGRVFFKDVRSGRRITSEPFKQSVCPRAKPQPKKEEPPVPFKARPMPKLKQAPTPVERAMVNISLENKKRQAEFYANPNCQPFRLRSLERPTNVDEIREEVEHRRNLENEYIPPKVSKCPAPPSKEIKLTTAAVLREHALYRKQVEADKKRVDAFETELRDEASFKAWQDEERTRFELGHALELKFRRDFVVAIAQAIQDAKQTIMRERYEVAEDVRHENQNLKAKREEFELNLELLNSLRRETVIQDREVMKEAVHKMLEGRRSRAQEIHQKTIEDEQESDAVQAAELKLRQEIVRQLRALEMEYVREVKKFDPDTAFGHGLLEEMSMSELRHRLQLVKEAFERERESRRNNIAAVKKERRNTLLEKAEFVRKMREVCRVEQISKREAKQRSRPSSVLAMADAQ